MDADARITQSWLDNASAWVQAVRAGLIPSRRAGTDAAIVEAVVATQPKSVLDAGCGEGWLARVLARHGIEVTGIDGSERLIERAREAGDARFLHISYDQFTAHPHDAGSAFDAVVFNFSLFAEDIIPVLRAAGHVLRPGGRLFIQTVHPFNDARDERYEDGWREENFASMSGDFRTPMPWYFRTMQSWTGAVTAAGFQLEALREPVNAETGRPLSLIIMARAA
ncbi:MAG TPA: class I SAM-dependent methyltransferase [Longimicrobiales bacterium]